MARRLVSSGHQVTMVCGVSERAGTGLTGPFRRGRREGEVDGIHVIELALPYSNRDHFPKRAWTFLRFAFRSVGIALRAKYDLALATSTPLTAGIPGIFARWLRGKPFVFEVRDLWPELPREMGVISNPVVLNAMSLLELISYKSAHGLIGLSPGIVDGIKRRGIEPGRITMIPNGCDLEVFGRVSNEDSEITSAVSLDEFVAVYAGAHGIANGLNSVLDAAAELQRRGNKRIKLLLIGDGMRKANLQQRAARDNLDNVLFLDPLSKLRLAALMARAGVGLMVLQNVPAFYNGTSPNKFFDYLAAGLPVVNNYPGWVAELIRHHRCGIAIPPNNACRFANALEELAGDPAMTVQYGENARRLAEMQFSRDDLACNFEKFLTSTLQSCTSKQGPKT
jgi:glycosyltransferase involved in cell wall biosynthesis